MSRPNIISMGEVLWDLFPDGSRFGGAPANFACHAAILGADVSFVSAVGDDEPGAEAVAFLDRYEVKTDGLQRLAGRATGSVSVELDEAGNPSYRIHENSAWDEVTWRPGLALKITAANAVYFGTLGQRGAVSRATIQKLLAIAKACGVPRILDVNLRPPYFDADLIRESIDAASILKLSDNELSYVADALGVSAGSSDEETLKSIRISGQLDIVVMTRGAAGAVLVAENQVVDQPGIPSAVIDTVGAGDAFTAAFTVGLLQRKLFEVILREACETAAAVCAQSGAVPNLKNA